jgi:hypothetical protein
MKTAGAKARRFFVYIHVVVLFYDIPWQGLTSLWNCPIQVGGLPGKIHSEKEVLMLYTVIAVLVVLWLLGLIGHIGGALIHLLLIAAVIAFVWHLIAGRRAL